MRPRAGRLRFALVVLCSLTGCTAGTPVVPQVPVIVETADCPAPPAPSLPVLDAALPFDAPQNVRVLLTRDDLCRQYIKGLQATVRCYEAQSNRGTDVPRKAPGAAPGKSPAASLSKER